jgi:serine phosphatase RsbU (regulator of sigma subunit)
VAQSGLVGGDLIAIYEGAAGERTAVVVDVSGHGAGAALGAASVRATLALLLRNHGPAAALSALNDELDNAASPRHACVAVVQIKGREATVVNAGLPPVYLLRGGRAILAVASSGVPPGLLAAQTYEPTSFAVEPGDRIAVVSDGLVEPFGLADDALPVLAELGVFDRARWTGTERPFEVADRVRQKLAPVALVQPDDASLLLIEVGA